MANFVTHIVLSDKVFKSWFSDKNLSEFILGTSFPDIRYFGVVERDKTHTREISIEEVRDETSSFQAGLKFHSLVDIVREKFVVENKLYSLLPESKYITQALKVYEDIVLYEKVSEWADYAQFFENIPKEELGYEIPASKLRQWHGLVRAYISHPPTDETISELIINLDFSSAVVDEIISNVSKIAHVPQVRTKTIEFYNNIETLTRATS